MPSGSRGSPPQRAGPEIVVVGAGIGGLTLAAALTRYGNPPWVLEQAPELGEVGSGLGVLPSAVHALRSIGVDEALFTEAAPLRRMHLANHRGEELSRLDLTRIFERVGGKGYVMRRSALHAALAACVDKERVRTGARVSGLRQSADRVELQIEGDDEPLIADVVIGADGLNSVVRGHLFGDVAPRYAGETIFRAIAECALERSEISREIFGPGRRLGCYEIGRGRTYYWATSPGPQGTRIPLEARRSHLQKCFAGWPFGVPDLIAQTREDRILQNDIFDRPPLRRWHHGRIALLGDAAHPMTPNMGQGACMAIEDAVVLARRITECGDLETALRSYTAARARRTAGMMRLSRVWGSIGLWRGPLSTRLRDGFYRATPDAVFERILVGQYGFRVD